MNRVESLSEHPTEATQKRWQQQSKPFIKGPIPLSWVQCASQLPGKAWSVGTVLFYLAGMAKTKTVVLSFKLLQSFGVDRFATYRALTALENAKLVTVKREAGKRPKVTILDYEGG